MLWEKMAQNFIIFPGADRGARTELARIRYRKDGGRIAPQIVKVRLLRLACRVGNM